MLSQVQWPSLSSFPAVSVSSSWTFVVPWVFAEKNYADGTTGS